MNLSGSSSSRLAICLSDHAPVLYPSALLLALNNSFQSLQ